MSFVRFASWPDHAGAEIGFDHQFFIGRGLRAGCGFPTSAVFRAGLAAYAKVFADTYAADNVRMNNIQCGWIDSLPTVIERRDGVPMKRYGSTAEIAATVAFLASEGAGYITGQNLRVDGGLGRSI